MIFLHHEKWKKAQEKFPKSNWESSDQSNKQMCWKYDWAGNLAQATAGIAIWQITTGDIDITKTDLQRILSGRVNRCTVSFVDKDQNVQWESRIHLPVWHLPIWSYILRLYEFWSDISTNDRPDNVKGYVDDLVIFPEVWKEHLKPWKKFSKYSRTMVSASGLRKVLSCNEA